MGILLLAAVCGCGAGAPPADLATSAPPGGIALVLDTAHPGRLLAPGAIGLSVEARELGLGELTVRRRRLVRLMRLLGPATLRIGGNTVDESWWTSSGERPPPWATSTITPAALRSLHGLLSAAGWQAILGVDLAHYDPARAAAEARAARAALGASLLGVEVGNEPNDYPFEPGLRAAGYSVADYLREARAYRAAIAAAAPGVALYGPALTQKGSWLSEMGASARIFDQITQHFYATSSCSGPPPAVAPSLPGLLSADERRLEERVLDTLDRVGRAAARPTRIDETNTVACLGIPSISPVFASALWALEWALRAGAAGVAGVSFHGEVRVCGRSSESPICAVGDYAPTAGPIRAQPELYGLLAARRLEGGRFLRTSLTGGPAPSSLTAFATLSAHGTITLALVDRALAGPAEGLSISLPARRHASVWPLTAPSLEARRGILFAGAPIDAQGTWQPRPQPLAISHGWLHLRLRPASAVVVTVPASP